jgi:hypothetical protein
MNFRYFSNSEVRSSGRERNIREKANKEMGGEVYFKCKNCEGTGLKFCRWGENNENTSWAGEFCNICGGTGYIDWVEAIMKGSGVVL